MSDTAPAEPVMFRHYFRCRGCGNRFSVLRKSDSPEAVKTPKCPRAACVKARVRESFVADIGMDVAAGKAPGYAGSVNVRAVDETQRIVAQDHHFTDMPDRIRVGESSAPKLAPHLQAQADAMFSGGLAQTGQMSSMLARAFPPSLLRQTALAGGFRSDVDPVALAHAGGRVPIELMDVKGEGR